MTAQIISGGHSLFAGRLQLGDTERLFPAAGDLNTILIGFQDRPGSSLCAMVGIFSIRQSLKKSV